MQDTPNKLSQFWQELKRRRVIHVIIVYATVAFVIIELVNNVFEPLRLPEWTPTLVILILAIGFPIVLIFSWIFDVTPEGIEKTKPSNYVKKGDKAATPNSWRIATYVEKPANLTPFRQLNLTTGSRDRLTPSFLTTKAKNFS